MRKRLICVWIVRICFSNLYSMNELSVEQRVIEELQRAAEFGDNEAQYELAKKLLLLSNDENNKNAQTGVTKTLALFLNQVKCTVLLAMAAKQGHQPAHILLAKEAEKQGDRKTAQCWYEKAAGLHNIEAHFALAKLHQQVSKRHERALPEMLKSFENVLQIPTALLSDESNYSIRLQARAAYELGSYYESKRSPSRAVEYYKRSLSYYPHLTEANYALATLYVKNVQLSHMTTEMIEHVRALLLKSATQNHTRAQRSLGDLLSHMNQAEEAYHWYVKASNAGDAQASFRLGTIHEIKEIASTNENAQYSKAVCFYEKATYGDCPQAFTALKRLAIQKKSGLAAYTLGRLIEVSSPLLGEAFAACFWYKKAFENGYNPVERLKAFAENSPVAAFLCGEIFLAQNDIESALFYFKKAASGKNYEALCAIEKLTSSTQTFSSQALLALGKLYQEGIGVTKNEKKALALFLKSDSADALYQASLCYARGQGTSFDEREAGRLAYEAAAKKHKEAYNLLLKFAEKNDWAAYDVGQLYENGFGVPKDESMAKLWYIKAGKSYGQAFYALGRLCESKSCDEPDLKNITSNYEDALTWYNKGAALCVPGSAEKADSIRSILSNFTIIRPHFRNRLLCKIKPYLVEPAPDFLCWVAYVTSLVCSHLVKKDRLMMREAIERLATFPPDSMLSRVVLKKIAMLIAPEDFHKKLPNPDTIATNLVTLRHICKGIDVLKKKVIDIVENSILRKDINQIKLIDAWTVDPCIAMLNYLFSDDAKNFDNAEFFKAVEKIVSYYKAAFNQDSITRDLLFNGTEDVSSLHNFLKANQLLTDKLEPTDLKERIVRIANILETCDSKGQAMNLVSWTLVRYGEFMRAALDFTIEKLVTETIKTIKAPLALRFSLALALFRKQCIHEYISSRVHQKENTVAYLEKKVHKIFGLLGYKESHQQDSSDLIADNKNVSAEDLKNLVLKLCTIDKLINYIIEQAQIETSIISHSEIAQYCAGIFNKALYGKMLHDPHAHNAHRAAEAFDKVTYELMFQEKKLTELGAKILLVHFGYCEPLNQPPE